MKAITYFFILIIFIFTGCVSLKTPPSLADEIITESNKVIKEYQLHPRFFKFPYRKQILEEVLNNPLIQNKKEYLLEEVIISNDNQYYYIIYDLIDKTKTVLIYKPFENNSKTAKVVVSATTKMDTIKYEYEEIPQELRMNDTEYVDYLMKNTISKLLEEPNERLHRNSTCLSYIKEGKLIWIKVYYT